MLPDHLSKPKYILEMLCAPIEPVFFPLKDVKLLMAFFSTYAFYFYCEALT